MLARSEGTHAARDPDIVDLVEQALTSAPLDSLHALAALKEALGALERRQVARALERGATFAELAGVLGISRQAAHRRYRGLAQPEPQPPLTLEPAPRSEPEISRAARAALAVARDEAARQGTVTIDSGHLLFGAIATADGIVARRLRALGATVEALRRPARGGPAARPGFDRIPAVRDGALHEIKSPLILQPGPAALTDGLDAIVSAVEEARLVPDP